MTYVFSLWCCVRRPLNTNITFAPSHPFPPSFLFLPIFLILPSCVAKKKKTYLFVIVTRLVGLLFICPKTCKGVCREQIKERRSRHWWGSRTQLSRWWSWAQVKNLPRFNSGSTNQNMPVSFQPRGGLWSEWCLMTLSNSLPMLSVLAMSPIASPSRRLTLRLYTHTTRRSLD